MLTLGRVVWAVAAPRCSAFSGACFSTCRRLKSPKKRSPYSSVDRERYSSLVKAVMSSRVSAQTPASLQEEDQLMYGPVVQAVAPPERTQRTEPKNFHPFFSKKQTMDTEEQESGPPVRIVLNRNQSGLSSVPSVTRILQQTLSPEQVFYLDRWKRRMVAELGEEGFREYSQSLFRQGKLFHSAVEDILTSEGGSRRSAEVSEFTPEVRGYLHSVSHILEEVHAVRAIESTVQHADLNYLGVADCVARYRGVLCVIDWKTSEKPKPSLSSTYDNPVQVAAYAGALNSDSNYKYQVDHGLIVVAYRDGSPAHAHQLSPELMAQSWTKWLLRLQDFTEQRSSRASSENR